MTGSIALTCAQRDGRSYLAQIRYDGLSRVSRPRRIGETAHVVLAHLGPGVIGGDRYALDVEVQAQASLLVTGQMATPVYARGVASSLDATWRAGSGASLVVRGEPVMLDPGAVHDARTTVDVAGDGIALVADIVTVAAGACARLRTIVRIDGRIVVRDACDLRALPGGLATIVVAAAERERRAHIAAALASVIAAADVRAGLGATGGAVIVRATADRVWALQRFIEAIAGAAALGEASPPGAPIEPGWPIPPRSSASFATSSARSRPPSPSMS